MTTRLSQPPARGGWTDERRHLGAIAKMDQSNVSILRVREGVRGRPRTGRKHAQTRQENTPAVAGKSGHKPVSGSRGRRNLVAFERESEAPQVVRQEQRGGGGTAVMRSSWLDPAD